MPLHQDLTGGLNLSRRPTAPVKLPRMNFPTMGEHVEPGQQPGPSAPTPDAAPEPAPAGSASADLPVPAGAAQSLPEPATAARVVVYGRSGCPACIEAVRDLMERNLSFSYVDVGSNNTALEHLGAICGGDPVVPVVVHMGFGGT